MNETLANQFKALGHPVRLQIMDSLLKRDFAVCCQLIKEFSLAQGTISRHLEVLRKAGFVRWHRSGNYVYYRAKRKELAEFKIQASLFGDSDRDCEPSHFGDGPLSLLPTFSAELRDRV